MVENNPAPTPEVVNDVDVTPFASSHNQEEQSNHNEMSGSGDVAAETSSETVPPAAKKKFTWRWWHTLLVTILVIVLIVGSTVGALAWYTSSIVLDLKSQALAAKEQGQLAYDAFKGQNLPKTQEELVKLKDNLTNIHQTYDKLSFYQAIPIVGNYYKDGLHVLAAGDAGYEASLESIQAITPHADVLGFTGEDTFTGGTAEDRLKILLKTLDEVKPSLDSIAQKLETANSELAAIDANRYPEEFRGIPVRSYVTQGQEFTAGTVKVLTEFRPVIEELPAIAGARNGRRKYLILFQNDNELRPTGGFLTAYATIFVEDGKVTPEKSDDIYEMDKKFKKRIAIPEALGRYLTTEKYWNLRDMNTSPDFKISMDQFLENYKTIKSEPQDLDGIIAVDTQVLTDLIRVLGPVEVPGYGTFSAENDPKCDCPQIIHALSEIITRPTPYIRQDRKGVIGPLMRAILTKAYSSPKQQWPELFTIGFKSIEGRHTQLYFFDEKAQAAALALNGGGIMKPPGDGEDFLAIVDANLGGAKSNLFTSYEVKQTVSAPENGIITKTVEVTYKNSRHGDNCNLEAGLLCLNSTLRDWYRLYVPLGAKVVDAQGFTQQPKVYDEQGFGVIDSFFILEPNSQAKVKLTYTVPYTDTNSYVLKLWKQGGIDPVKMLLDVNGNEQEIIMDKDMTVKVPF